MKRLVLVGGGHSHVYVLEALGKAPLSGVEMTLVSRTPYSAYSGMLPGLIAGHYGFHDCHIDLARLARCARIKFLVGEVQRLDLAEKCLWLSDGSALSYDLLSLNIGSTPMTGADIDPSVIIKAKPTEGFLSAWEALQQRILQEGGAFSIGVVGGGAAGIELALAMQVKLTSTLGKRTPRISFEIVTDTKEILAAHSLAARRILTRILQERGIGVHSDCRVTRVARGTLYFAHGERLGCQAAIWATGAAAPAWPKHAGLRTDSDGFIEVNDSLQSISHPEVFAAGDIAHQVDHPRPKSGVFAVRQGPALAANLRHTVLGQLLVGFIPQSRTLALISAGNKHAVMSWGSVALEGAWVWRWKDRIDRRFVERFNRSGAARPSSLIR